MTPSPSIGVCVLNWNSGNALSQCVQGLHGIDHFKLVIVDNASSDGSCRAAQEKFPDVPVIVNASNLGYSTGNNVGAAYLLDAGCDVLTFVNPDVTISPSALNNLVGTLLSDPKTGCVGGVPSAQPGKACLAARTRPSAVQKVILYGPLNQVGPVRRLCREHFIDPASLPEGCEVYAVVGACIAFRAQAFREIDGFDEGTFLYEEEFIVAERLRAYGWCVRLSKKATYFHTEAVSTSKMPYRRKLHFYASEFYLLHHYYGWNSAACSILWLYRHMEWIACLPLWIFQRSVSPLFRLRGVNAPPKGLRP